MKIGSGNFELLDRVMKRRQDAAAVILALESPIQRHTPRFQPFTLVLGCLVGIGNVVGVTHESIEGAERITFRSRQQGEPIIKIAGGRASQAAAMFVRRRQVFNVEHK